MPNPRHLNSAPIVEGIIDIQVTTPAGLQANVFRKLAEKYSPGGRIEEVRSVGLVITQIAGKPPQQTVQDSGPIGLRFVTKDEKIIGQMRKNGFTFSRLSPYTSWEEIFPQAAEMFNAYLAIAEPEQVTRIAVRNINRLLFPRSRFDESPGAYLVSPPNFPRDLSSKPTHWMTRIMLKQPSGLEAIVTQVTEDKSVNNFQPVILDIDVFKADAFPLDPNSVLQSLGPLREWKNALFFEALTEEALTLFT